jgi:23S rRNA pseudouridine1911/1915/1917 synthase
LSDELVFEVDADEGGQRVDRFVTTRLKAAGHAYTRSDVQRWIAEGRVRVDGAVVAKKTALKPGASVSVAPGKPLLSEAEPDPSVTFGVVYEDGHLIVIDKPAGLVVHPARGHRTGTLVNGLLARPGFTVARADPRDPEGHLRPGIVHRLDKDTSGLMVVAKSAACREGLKALFAEHDIERSYLAVAIGQVRAQSFDTLHGRHPKSRMRFTSRIEERRAASPGVRRARTDVEPIREVAGCTLVRCTLHTGRTHQIRVHMLEQAKAPLLGDPLYRKNVGDARIRAIGEELGRQALHAAVLGFVHPVSGEAMRWEADLPDDMQRALDALAELSVGGVSSKG